MNNISLFGLVLAIGIVVDDAIVVVENVERWMERGLAAARGDAKGDGRSDGADCRGGTGAVCGVRAVRVCGRDHRAVFRQFAVTIAVSTVFSAINSLTLSPALAAILLKPRDAQRDPLTWVLDMSLGWFFRLFNGSFGAGTAAYAWAVGKFIATQSDRAAGLWGTDGADVFRLRAARRSGLCRNKIRGG